MDVFLLFICFFILSWIFYYSFNRLKRPPGPFPYPFIGNTSLVKKLSQEHNGFHNALTEISKLYKTDILSIKLGKESMVVVQSENILNQVLMREEFQARPDNFFLRIRCMGKRQGITMTDGPLWNEQRTFAVKHLHALGFGKRRMEDMIQRQLQEMLSTLDKWDVSSIKLRKLLSKCVLNVLWEIITGETFHNNEEKLNDLLSFMEERAKAFDISGGLLAHFPLIRFILPEYSGFKLIQNLNNKFRNLILTIINSHKKSYSKDETRDFIDAFLHEMENRDASSTFTEDQLIMVCLDFFIAGSQTTSSTLDFLFLHMILNPDIQEKVQNELDRILKPGELPCAADRMKCPYIEAVILESQRLSSVVPVIGPRRVLKETTLGNYVIPKGTTVLLNIGQYNQDSHIWKEPKLMNPDRFLDENGRVTTEQKLFSFGRGKRRCPGEALARNFIFIFFSGILFNYKLQVQDKRNPPSVKVVPGITSSPVEYAIKMTKRFS